MIFFSYPASFTPVYTTGFMTFACMQPEFEKLRFDCIEATCNGG
jgi:alkyl hydroperoxide reductase subunit AhpC